MLGFFANFCIAGVTFLNFANSYIKLIFKIMRVLSFIFAILLFCVTSIFGAFSHFMILHPALPITLPYCTFFRFTFSQYVMSALVEGDNNTIFLKHVPVGLP
jgi:hypothetical protein